MPTPSYPASIETPRLLLREHRRGDFPNYFRLFSDPDVAALTYNDVLADERAARREFRAVLRHPFARDRRHHYFAVFAKDGAGREGAYAGECGFDVLKRNAAGGIAEIGYFLRKEARGKGYAKEIAAALVRFCFEEAGMHKVVATCDARNAASERVMAAIGMRKEGELRGQRYKEGRWVTELLYAVLKDEAARA